MCVCVCVCVISRHLSCIPFAYGAVHTSTAKNKNNPNSLQFGPHLITARNVTLQMLFTKKHNKTFVSFIHFCYYFFVFLVNAFSYYWLYHLDVEETNVCGVSGAVQQIYYLVQ